MDKIEEFLNTLTLNQIKNLDYILKNEIAGDVDYFLFKVEEYVYNISINDTNNYVR